MTCLNAAVPSRMSLDDLVSPLMVALNQLDEQLAELREQHPGWRLWYVPSATGPVTWCAHRLPTLNEASPGDLSKAIAEAEAAHLAETGSVGGGLLP
jgi:hypothetical protein